MRCLLKYDWVKLYRDRLPEGKGIMGAWAKLASRAAFRKGHASYCGHINAVSVGMWSGGIVGLKSILGVKSRTVALETMDKLQELGYLQYSLNSKTKKLTYKISDWVVKCSGAGCMDGAVYATEGYGFLCLPRNITQRLADKNYIFDEADAWLDLWCHTVSEDPSNAFSFLAPAVQFRYEGALLTLEKLGQRWGWEKTKVWRFFKAKDTLTNPNQSMCAECAAKYAAAKARDSAGYIEGTQLAKISNMTPSAANTSGVRGVYYESKFDRWRAEIRFQRKRYYLGTYKNKEDAIKARLAAEADLYEPFLERLKNEEII